jgi:hypothetical protein
MASMKKHLSYANVMATIAVFLALGGVGVAAKALKKNSVGTKQLKSKAVNAGKLADGAVTEPKIAGNAVTEPKIADGSVGLAKAANSLHQHCRGGTVYVVGACIDLAEQGGPGVDYTGAQSGCTARAGSRLASAAELSSLVRGDFGTIASDSWALEALPGAVYEVVDVNGHTTYDNGIGMHAYRCAFNPLS